MFTDFISMNCCIIGVGCDAGEFDGVVSLVWDKMVPQDCFWLHTGFPKQKSGARARI